MFEQPLQNSVENNIEQEEKQKGEVVVILGASMNALPEDKGEFEDYANFPLHVKHAPDSKGKLLKTAEGRFVDSATNEEGDKIEVQNVEIVGGDVRFRAAKAYVEELEKQQPGRPVVVFTTGGVELDGRSRAVGGREKLIGKHGLDEEQVKALPSGGSTMGNARAATNYARDHRDQIGKLEEIKIVTNGFHVVRAWAMFTHALHKEYLGGDLAEMMSTEDKEKITQILDTTLKDVGSGDRDALAQVQEVYAKYIEDDQVKVKAIIAEDMIESSGEVIEDEVNEKVIAITQKIKSFSDKSDNVSLEQVSSFTKELDLLVGEVKKLSLESKAKEKYANRLREDEGVQIARKNERKGLKDLLAGKYQVR